ncbi:hypothetical protein [Pedobacter changchengzhani]|nr:hypothetical protein [Pedobacter changchengzhani]
MSKPNRLFERVFHEEKSSGIFAPTNVNAVNKELRDISSLRSLDMTYE